LDQILLPRLSKTKLPQLGKHTQALRDVSSQQLYLLLFPDSIARPFHCSSPLQTSTARGTPSRLPPPRPRPITRRERPSHCRDEKDRICIVFHLPPFSPEEALYRQDGNSSLLLCNLLDRSQGRHVCLADCLTLFRSLRLPVSRKRLRSICYFSARVRALGSVNRTEYRQWY
jgi:hypothetical protein